MAAPKKTKNVSIEQLIKSIGTTVLVVGWLFTIMPILSTVIMISKEIAIDNESLVNAAVVMIPLSIYWIFAGRSIKKHASDSENALMIIGQVTATSVVFTLMTAAETVTVGASTGIIFTVTFSIYMYWSYRDLKKRIGAN